MIFFFKKKDLQWVIKWVEFFEMVIKYFDKVIDIFFGGEGNMGY